MRNLSHKFTKTNNKNIKKANSLIYTCIQMVICSTSQNKEKQKFVDDTNKSNKHHNKQSKVTNTTNKFAQK